MCPSYKPSKKAKLATRRGWKATGLVEIAGLTGRGQSGFFIRSSIWNPGAGGGTGGAGVSTGNCSKHLVQGGANIMNANSGSISWWKITLAAMALAVASLAPSAHAGPVVINFDSFVVAPGGQLSGAPLTSYLAGYGVTISGEQPGQIPVVYNCAFPGSDQQAPSPPNMFWGGSVTPIATMTLNFSTPVSNFSFETPGYLAEYYSPSGVTLGPWSATAYKAAGVILGSTGQGAIGTYSDIPIQTYTIAAQGIKYINFTGDNYYFYGSTIPWMDNLTFTTSTVPLPGAIWLLGSGLLGLAGLRRFRKS